MNGTDLCITDYFLLGREEDLEKLLCLVNSLFEGEEEDREESVLLGRLGFDSSLKGVINECFFGDGGLMLYVSEEEKPGALKEFLEKKGFSVFFISKNPILGLFQSNDKDGRYFKERYIALNYYGEASFFEKREEAEAYAKDKNLKIKELEIV